jgi:hypothetical protein
MYANKPPSCHHAHNQQGRSSIYWNAGCDTLQDMMLQCYAGRIYRVDGFLMGGTGMDGSTWGGTSSGVWDWCVLSWVDV